MPPPGYKLDAALNGPRKPAGAGSGGSDPSGAATSSNSSSSDDEAAHSPVAVTQIEAGAQATAVVHPGSTTEELSSKLAELAARDRKLAAIVSPPRSKTEPYPAWLQRLVPNEPTALQQKSFDPASSPNIIKDKLVELAARDKRLAAGVTALPGHSTPLAERQHEHAARKSPAISPPNQRVGHTGSTALAGSSAGSPSERSPTRPTEQHKGTSLDHTTKRSHSKSRHKKPGNSAELSSSSGRSKRVSGIEALRDKAARLRREKAQAVASLPPAEPTPAVELPAKSQARSNQQEPAEPKPDPQPPAPSVVLETVDALRRVSLAAAAAQLTPVVTPGDKRVDRLLAGKGEAFEEIPLDGRTVVAGGRALHVGTGGQPEPEPEPEPQQQQQQQQQGRPQLSPRRGPVASASNTDAGAGEHQVTSPTKAQERRHPYLDQYKANAAKHAAGRPTLRGVGERRVPSALRTTAHAATSGTRAAVVNTILNQKHAAATASTGGDNKIDSRTLGMATKIRAKAVAHMAGRGQNDASARRKVVRFASKDMQQHHNDHLRSVPAKVRRHYLASCYRSLVQAEPKLLLANKGQRPESRLSKRPSVRKIAKPKTTIQLEEEVALSLATTVWDMTDRMGSDVVELAIGVFAVFVIFAAMAFAVYVS